MRSFALSSVAALRPFRPVRAESAAAFRIAFGVLGLAAAVRFAANGWIGDLYIEPARRFAYSGFWWVVKPPEWGIYALFALIAIAAACVALRLLYRAAITAFFALFTYVELIDKTTYLNHYYLVSLLAALMMFLPLGGLASADAAIARRRGGRRGVSRGFISAWTVWALRAQVGAVYVFGGIAKLDSDWLLNAQPLRIWLRHSADLPLIGPALSETWVAYAMSWGGAAFDLSIVGFLLWSRSRPFAYAALAAFHLATWALFPAIGMFPIIMICLSLIFFPPDWPSALWRRVRRRTAAESESARASPSWSWSERLTARRKVGLAVVIAVALLQIAVPLRHFAYPGDARWNEDGARFSWRVMLTERTGHVRFRARDAATGEEWLEYPDDYLTPLQAERMAHQPDMILATARMIAERWRGEGRAVEVRADAFVTVNGRRAARFVDPETDLASVQPGVLPKRWVLDAPWR